MNTDDDPEAEVAPRFIQNSALRALLVDEIAFHNLVTLAPFNPGIARMDVQATPPESERKSPGLRDWILYLALAATTCADVIAALLGTRPEPQQVLVPPSERYHVIKTYAAGRGAITPTGLTVDTAGNLYGSTFTGGPGSGGTIFELIPPSLSGSRWKMQVLPNVENGPIGTEPFWNMIAQNGDLYGATTEGGARLGGTLYKFQSDDHGWGEPIPLVNFATRPSPEDSLSELISDSSGSLYGTSRGRGGKDAAGTVFKLSPGPDGWTMTVLHRFSGGDDDGAYPYGGLTMDGVGALYGTTGGGGKDKLGTVFKLTPTDHGWEQTLLHTFRQMDGSQGEGGLSPMAGLTLGDDGTLYGTTAGGGKFGAGVVFSLTPSDHNGWSERVLYHFKRKVGDGFAPNSRLVFGKSGGLYGTTKAGGDMSGFGGFGTVFKLVPTATGWSEVVLHCFTGGADGAQPTGTLIRDPSGNLFGTTVGGARSGVYNDGTVFEIETGGFLEGSSKAPSGPK